MATWETGLPPSATSGSLNLPTFATVRRGYDPDQVLEYVTRLTDHLDALATEVRRLQAELSQRDVATEEQAPNALVLILRGGSLLLRGDATLTQFRLRYGGSRRN